MKTPFRIYVRENCPFCDEALLMFEEAGIIVEEINIAGDPVATNGIMVVSGQLMTVVPTIISFTTGEVIVGLLRDRIQGAIAQWTKQRK